MSCLTERQWLTKTNHSGYHPRNFLAMLPALQLSAVPLIYRPSKWRMSLSLLLKYCSNFTWRLFEHILTVIERIGRFQMYWGLFYLLCSGFFSLRIMTERRVTLSDWHDLRLKFFKLLRRATPCVLTIVFVVHLK